MINGKKVIGIVSEYDPFHNGHKYLIESAKSICSADFVCSVMSGCFMQRGTLSMFSPHDRATMSCLSLVDIVFQMPVYSSLRDADNFAYSAVYALEKLGFIDYIAFGAEDDNLNDFYTLSDYFVENDLFSSFHVNDNSKKNTFIKNLLKNIGCALGDKYKRILEKPNNILALNYIISLRKLKSNIKPIIIKRTVNHDSYDEIYNFSSASALREHIKSGNINKAKKFIPIECHNFLDEILFNYHINKKEFSENIVNRLFLLSQHELKQYYGITEGLENRLHKAILNYENIQDILYYTKTKRYPLARIRRILSYISLDLKRDELLVEPEFIRLLAYKSNFKKNLKLLSESKIRIITSNVDMNNLNITYDEIAYKLWAKASGTFLNFKKTKVFVIKHEQQP